MQADEIKFEISPEIKPTTRRGVLSTVNSLYDPMGFIAPVTIQGKLILRKVISFTTDWDEPLPYHLLLERTGVCFIIFFHTTNITQGVQLCSGLKI